MVRPQAGMTQRFCVLSIEPGLAGWQFRRLTALLVRDCAPPACPIIWQSVIVTTAGGVGVGDSAIPGHSVPATAPRYVRKRNSVRGSALLLVTLLSCSGSDSESKSGKGTTVSTSICSPTSSLSSSFASSFSSV